MPNNVTLAVLLHITLETIFIIRVLLRSHRQPSSRIAWIAIIAALPLVGIIAYVLFGEVNIGRRRAARLRAIVSEISTVSLAEDKVASRSVPEISEQYEPLFRLGHSISHFEPVPGNQGRLLENSNATIDSLVQDIDAATDHVHILFYIWLTDNNGCKVMEAVKRATARGVTCRVMVDDLGSRQLLKSSHWKALQTAGVKTAVALQIGNPFLRLLTGRIDLRNHRKIVVIDNKITYCGSQNCADPEFRVKPRYAPWVDAVIRFTGPIVQQNQLLFASDWMTYAKEKLTLPAGSKPPVSEPGFYAQVIGTGPTVRNSSMPEMFETLAYFARHELLITTPYYVPDESLQNAICSAAFRGVRTTLILPARNDSRIVAATSHSFYRELLQAGVQLYEYRPGLLHSKTLTIDGQVCLIGSANMDRRSFDLNYENNILFHDPELTKAVRQRQLEYLEDSQPVTIEQVDQWSLPQQLWNNTLAMFSPIL